MGLADWIMMVFAIWAIVVSVRTIRRIGIRRFSRALGRLGWDIGKVVFGASALVIGAMAAGTGGRRDQPIIKENGGYDPLDYLDPANVDRADSPYFIENKSGEM
jgi:hypothetical protein